MEFRDLAARLERVFAIHRAGDLAAAERGYRELIVSGAEHYACYGNLASILLSTGRSAEALGLLQRALELRPDHFESRMNLGQALEQRGRLDEACAIYEDALRTRPNERPAYCILAAALRKAGRTDEAASRYEEVLRLDPDYIEAANDFGVLRLDQGRLEEAEALLTHAVETHPQHAAAWNNLGLVHTERREFVAARACFERALASDACYAEALSNLGSALDALGHNTEALVIHERAVALRPTLSELHVNRGTSLLASGRLREAQSAYERAITLAPLSAEAHEYLGHALLLAGDFPRGWREYEWRLQRLGQWGRLPAGLRKWDGNLAFRGPLLLRAEQGLGDTLMFSRFGAALRGRGMDVRLLCPAKLAPLLRLSGLFDDVYDETSSLGLLPSGTQWLPLLSAPRVLEALPDDPFAGKGYLRAPPERAAYWRARLHERDELVIGIAWQGNPAAERGHLSGRSFPLERMTPLVQVDGVKLVSLQRGPGAEQVEQCAFRDRFVGARLEAERHWDFMEVAAIMAGCDLIVSSDTAAAHLAAALGRPTWIALKHVPEWRWRLGRADTAWYANARLFRQSVPGAWEAVFASMASELACPATV